MHQMIPKNKLGRDFIMGDLHGRYDLLKAAKKYHGFDETRDRLFSVGDIINRGNHSAKCLQLLSEPWFYMVRGNHEQMMLEAFTRVDTYAWMSSYGRWTRKIEEKKLLKWVRRIESLPLSMTVKGRKYAVGICHAEPAGKSWPPDYTDTKAEHIVMWGRRVLRTRPSKSVNNIDFTVHGHTPLKRPTWVGNRYFMDTGAWYSENLTFRKLDDIHTELSATASLFN